MTLLINFLWKILFFSNLTCCIWNQYMMPVWLDNIVFDTTSLDKDLWASSRVLMPIEEGFLWFRRLLRYSALLSSIQVLHASFLWQQKPGCTAVGRTHLGYSKFSAVARKIIDPEFGKCSGSTWLIDLMAAITVVPRLSSSFCT